MTFWRRAAAAAALATLGTGLTATPASAAFPDQPFTQTHCEGDTDSVARLYAAALGRDPELGGFEFWVEEYTAGDWTLPRMAQFFVESPEFQAKYGALSNREFVELLYRNVHRREGDPGGVDFWVSEMAAGMSRATVLLRFSESPENVANTGSVFPTLGAYNEGRTDGAFTCGPDMGGHVAAPSDFQGYGFSGSAQLYRWSEEDQCFSALNLPGELTGAVYVMNGGAVSVEHELHHFATPLGAERHLDALQAMVDDCSSGVWTFASGGTLTWHDGGAPTIGDRSIEIQARFAATDGSTVAINHTATRVGNVISVVTYWGDDARSDVTHLTEASIVDALRAAGF